MIAFLLSGLAVPLPQNPINQELLENGSFSALSGVSGAHWCGGEGKTQTQGTVTFARVQPGDRLFQQVGKFQAPGAPAVAFSLQVRPQAARDVGLVTISEGTAAGEAINWQFVREVPGAWSAYARASGVWTAMTFNEDPTSPHHQFVGSNSYIRFVDTQVADAVELYFAAANAADVVALVRPILADGHGPNAAVQVEVLLDADGFGGNPPTTLDTYTVGPGAPHGSDRIVPMHLGATQSLVFRASNLTPGGAPVNLIWRPAIRYEQLRMTYAFTFNGTAPTGTSAEGVQTIVARDGQWNTRTLPFEADFAQLFQRAPRAPFLVELRGHTGTVDFTAMSCTHLRTTADYAGVRTAVLDEVERVVENYRVTQDDLPLPPPNGASPWKLYLLDPQTGKQTPPTFVGFMPPNVRQLLQVGFWEREYDDYSRIFRTAFDPTNRHPSTRLFWTAYNCLTDAFDTTTANQTTGTGAGWAALEIYRHTGDATFLEIARDYALVIATNGVVDAVYTDPATQVQSPDIRNDLVLASGYRVDDETNPHTSAPGGLLLAWGMLDAPAFLAQVAAELRVFANAHPAQTVLVAEPLLEQVARTAIEKAEDLKVFYPGNIPMHSWHGWWYSLAFQFSDIFAYNANWATETADVLAPLVGTGVADVDAMHATLVDYVATGVSDYLERWEINAARSSINAADQWRTWLSAAWLVKNAASLGAAGLTAGEITRVKAQLQRLARRFAAFQLPDGVWVNANQDEFYMIDQAGGGGTDGLRASFFAPSFALALQADPTNQQLRDNLFTRMQDVFDSTLAFFAQDPAFPYGYVPDYYCAGMPSCPDSPIETETRVIDNYLFGIRTFDQVLGVGQAAPRPHVSISPTSFAPSPVPAASFQFTITAPPGENLTNMLTSRTRIRRHHRTGGTGPWAVDDIWPGPPGSWIFWVNGQTAVLEYAVPQGPGDEFKFEVVSWTQDRRWHAATSLQRW